MLRDDFPDLTSWLESPVTSSVARLTWSDVTAFGKGPDLREEIVSPRGVGYVFSGSPGERKGRESAGADSFRIDPRPTGRGPTDCPISIGRSRGLLEGLSSSDKTLRASPAETRREA